MDRTVAYISKMIMILVTMMTFGTQGDPSVSTKQIYDDVGKNSDNDNDDNTPSMMIMIMTTHLASSSMIPSLLPLEQEALGCDNCLNLDWTQRGFSCGFKRTLKLDFELNLRLKGLNNSQKWD